MERLSKGNGTLAVAYLAAFLSHLSEMMTSFRCASFRRAAADSRCLPKSPSSNQAHGLLCASMSNLNRHDDVEGGDECCEEPQNRSWLNYIVVSSGACTLGISMVGTSPAQPQFLLLNHRRQ